MPAEGDIFVDPKTGKTWMMVKGSWVSFSSDNAGNYMVEYSKASPYYVIDEVI